MGNFDPLIPPFIGKVGQKGSDNDKNHTNDGTRVCPLIMSIKYGWLRKVLQNLT